MPRAASVESRIDYVEVILFSGVPWEAGEGEANTPVASEEVEEVVDDS